MRASIPSSSLFSAAAASPSLRMSLLVLIVTAVAPSTMAFRRLDGHIDHENPEAAEANVRHDPTHSVVYLNGVTFNTTVQQDHVDHWIVLFCVDWFNLCQGLWHTYRTTASHWEQAMTHSSKSWVSTAVRFAEVDCATDKHLCKQRQIESYPTVRHLVGGKVVKEWELTEDVYQKGMSAVTDELNKWIGKELVGHIANSNKDVSDTSPTQNETTAEGPLGSGLRELSQLLSWKSMWEDPASTAFGYFILAAAVGLFSWVLGTGLELEAKSILPFFGKEAKPTNWRAALLPEFPELPPPRTIVRNSIEL